jgi:hypothetical protein
MTRTLQRAAITKVGHRIKHTCARCDPESEHVGVEDIEAYLSAWLHHQDIAFK